MTYKITVIDAIEDLIDHELNDLIRHPEMLKTLLYLGFAGYQHLDLDQVAELYDGVFYSKTKGHIQIIDSVNPPLILAEYKRKHINIIDKDNKHKKPDLKIVKK